MGKDQVPLLKDRANQRQAAEPGRRRPDIVVSASGSGLQIDAKPGWKSE